MLQPRTMAFSFRGSAGFLMLWFVALVAILNIGVGYAVAVYLGAGRKRVRSGERTRGAVQYESFGDAENGDSDDAYAQSVEENELESVSVG
jgi:hypothetical protein